MPEEEDWVSGLSCELQGMFLSVRVSDKRGAGVVTERVDDLVICL